MVSSDKRMDFINNSIRHFLHLIFKLVSRDYYSDRSSDGRPQKTAEKASNPEEKMEVIEEARKNPILSIRERFDCGKTQIASILKDKDKWISLYEANASANSCQTSLRARKSDFGEVNEILYKWYLACSKNIYLEVHSLLQRLKRSQNVLVKVILKVPMDGGINGKENIMLSKLQSVESLVMFLVLL